MTATLIHLQVMLPVMTLLDCWDVTAVVAETQRGFFGLLPHRLDCVASLTPGILSYRPAIGEEQFIALDTGVLVKAGFNITVSARRAVKGPDLAKLHTLVEQEFLRLDTEQTTMHATMMKLENGFLRRLANFQQI